MYTEPISVKGPDVWHCEHYDQTLVHHASVTHAINWLDDIDTSNFQIIRGGGGGGGRGGVFNPILTGLFESKFLLGVGGKFDPPFRSRMSRHM